MIWIELFAGSASVAMELLGLGPLTTYQGGKRYLAPDLLKALSASGRPSQVILGDVGPWGEVWRVCSSPAGALSVAGEVERWSGDPMMIWEHLASLPVPVYPWGPAEVAHYLYLQGRQICGAPLWPEDEYPGRARVPELGRWRYGCQREATSPNPRHRGNRGKQGWGRGTGKERSTQGPTARLYNPGGKDGSGLTPAGLVRRLRALAAVAAEVEIQGGRLLADDLLNDLRARGGLEGAVVYLDPPYVGGTGYCLRSDREGLLALARTCREAGATVAISEACGLADELGPGWYEADLSSRHRGHGREWLTASIPLDTGAALYGPLLSGVA